MKNFKSNIERFLALIVSAILLTACTLNYSFTGASIPVQAQTFSVEQIQNVATMVIPVLSTTMTDGLKDRMSRQTRLSQINEDGDLAFSGEITNYVSAPIAVTGDEYAALNRLTITVKIRFKNKYDSKADFEKSFSAYSDYDATKLMQEVEGTLIPEITEQLIEDIFNAAVSNW